LPSRWNWSVTRTGVGRLLTSNCRTCCAYRHVYCEPSVPVAVPEAVELMVTRTRPLPVSTVLTTVRSVPVPATGAGRPHTDGSGWTPPLPMYGMLMLTCCSLTT
jgi:hypothetical protein